jgi:hypothetical protein
MRHQPRSIVVDNEPYEWVLRHNSLFVDSDRHIAVYSPSAKGQTLYLDPYAWEFEVRPITIAEAIRFALSIGRVLAAPRYSKKSVAPPQCRKDTFVLATTLMISKVASSTQKRSLRQVRRFPTPCWRIFHSPSP